MKTKLITLQVEVRDEYLCDKHKSSAEQCSEELGWQDIQAAIPDVLAKATKEDPMLHNATFSIRGVR